MSQTSLADLSNGVSKAYIAIHPVTKLGNLPGCPIATGASRPKKGQTTPNAWRAASARGVTYQTNSLNPKYRKRNDGQRWTVTAETEDA
jgi:hypothetical protein